MIHNWAVRDPASPTSLDVYLHRDPVGVLSRLDGGGYEFAYAPAVVDRIGEGSVLLSHSLPVRAGAFDHAEAQPYFGGLLPDGMRRERIARELGLEPAGVADDELEELLDIPPSRLFDPDRPRQMRFALPGERHKLALVHDFSVRSSAWSSTGRSRRAGTSR
ncbi:MAG: HipA N-terminal domain-containing protein [Mycobacteriales bacterium]